MNAQLLAKTAYGAAAAPTRTDRGTEYALFSQVTSRLKSAATHGNYPALIEALHANRQMWTTLAADVSDKQNELSQEVRARIFYLYEFTQKHSRKVARGQASADALVEINVAIMKGLGQGARKP